ncbi:MULTISPECIES: hypothetical protein [Actinoalloteichus]|uniref:Uncharacterized protein n=1 Tax=Actinoalloteichus fjordicus TaxID=1612552 RepID=A0AAC9LBX1_9PSEU|nr:MULTISPECIES: hypothetical protein [Actinoalloteichus]APU14079.1 hypothetical protein UA74_10080 [Actinoalloteichus fjordicus]APU20026.1 hypothetical protein UA75_10055 [Actinoalloteichus sp. GBA129-24]
MNTEGKDSRSVGHRYRGRLHRAHALLTQARQATIQADAAIADGAVVFSAATHGSTQPEVAQINQLAVRSTEDVRAARALRGGAQEIIDGYCRHIAGHGIGDAETSPPGVSPAGPAGPSASWPVDPNPSADVSSSDPEVRYAEWITELKRGGTKISPARIVRMIRHRCGHLVWLETGDPDHAGQAHILRPKRRKEFADAAIPEHEIIDVVFRCLRRGRFVGKHKAAEVYEIEIHGGSIRIAITIGDNGFIVTAHPISRKRKLS